MTGFNPIGNTANITAQGRGPAFQPVQSKAVSYPARPTLNPMPGQGGGMGGSLGSPGAPGSSPDGGMGSPMGAFGMGPGGAPGAPGGTPGMPGGSNGPQMGPASTAGLLGQEKDQMIPGAGDGGAPMEGAGAFGSMGSPMGAPGGLKPASPLAGASGFGNGVAGRGAPGAFGGGASGFGRR